MYACIQDSLGSPVSSPALITPILSLWKTISAPHSRPTICLHPDYHSPPTFSAHRSHQPGDQTVSWFNFDLIQALSCDAHNAFLDVSTPIPKRFCMILKAVTKIFQNILVFQIIDGRKWWFCHSISITKTKFEIQPHLALQWFFSLKKFIL